MAAHEVIGLDLLQHRRLGPAEVGRVAAARVKIAAGGRVRGIGHAALQDDALRAQPRVGLGHRGEERLGVGMLRGIEEGLRRRDLGDAAHIHDRHPLADVLHHAQIVRHEEIGQPQLLLKVEQQVQDLRLDRHIERGDRFIGHDEPRVKRQGARDADALALAAAERVRETTHVLGPQAHQAEQLGHACGALIGIGHAVHQQRLAHDLQQRHARVQRRIGILEDHLHLAAQRLQLAARQGGHIYHAAFFGAKQDLSRGRIHRA